MSDQSSESSGEWVVLNEDEEELSLGNVEEFSNMELHYENVCDAVSASIRSSVSSEELEWQYEQLESDTAPSRVQELNIRESDIEGYESEDSNVEEDITNKFAALSDVEDYDNIDLASISKSNLYKHQRNEHLNIVLNLILSLVIASALGLGIGHFLGWSHKCYKRASFTNNPVGFVNFPEVDVRQKIKTAGSLEKEIDPFLLTENLSHSVSCVNPIDEGSSSLQDIFDVPANHQAHITITPTSENIDVLKIKFEGTSAESNDSDTHLTIAPQATNVITADIDWNRIQAMMQEFYGGKEIPVDDSHVFEDNVNSDNHELGEVTYLKVEPVVENKEVQNHKTLFFVGEDDDYSDEDKLNDAEYRLTKQFSGTKIYSNKETNLTNQLREDLGEVVRSLTAVALTRLADIDDKYVSQAEQSELVVKLYEHFQDLINKRINDIDNFVLSAENGKYQKFSPKYLQKMVYSLVDSVDYLMRVSFKFLSNDNKRINMQKFSNSISKVIFSFNKSWNKNNRFWSAAVEKVKLQESREKFRKENKQWKKKPQKFEKQYQKNYKNKRYSMKF